MTTLIKALNRITADKLPQSAFKRKQSHDDDDVIDLPDKPPKILYHVTDRKNLDSIKRKGLVPSIGEITRSAHGDPQNPAIPLVYLYDTIAHGVHKHYGRNALIITVDPQQNDIWLFTGMELVELGPFDWGDIIDEGDFPVGIEAGDYYSEVQVTPLKYYDYKGNKIE